MRIIAGRLGGRVFGAPHGHRTHPMSDKIRGALFNTLGDITGLTVLDAFAGSGALSIEAVSRGASHAIALDPDASAFRAITENITDLDVAEQITARKITAKAWLTLNKQSFDIVLCDPPYDDIPYKSVEAALKRTNPGGVAVLSLPPKARIIIPSELQLVQEKSYGDATLAFYRRIE